MEPPQSRIERLLYEKAKLDLPETSLDYNNQPQNRIEAIIESMVTTNDKSESN